MEQDMATEIAREIRAACVEINKVGVTLVASRAQKSKSPDYMICIRNTLASMEEPCLRPILKKYGLEMKQKENNILVYTPKRQLKVEQYALP